MVFIVCYCFLHLFLLALNLSPLAVVAVTIILGRTRRWESQNEDQFDEKKKLNSKKNNNHNKSRTPVFPYFAIFNDRCLHSKKFFKLKYSGIVLYLVYTAASKKIDNITTTLVSHDANPVLFKNAFITQPKINIFSRVNHLERKNYQVQRERTQSHDIDVDPISSSEILFGMNNEIVQINQQLELCPTTPFAHLQLCWIFPS